MENNFQLVSASISDRGLSEKRPQNEDSFLEMQKLGLFAVADGVGGAQAGDVASQMAVEILGEAFVNLHANGDAEEMMKIAIERANSAIYQMSSDLPQLSTMATTIVALHVSGNIATIGHVGDSRLYRLDPKGSLFRETQDHSVVEEEVRAGRMTAAQAASHPSRNVISRALGAESTVEVDMKTIMFDGNTKFLLCSDGITRHIDDFEIRDLLISSSDPDQLCLKMKEICYTRGAEDNLTAVIIDVGGQSASNNNFEGFSTIPIDEESTVAAARPQIAEEQPASFEAETDEIPTRALEMPASMQTQPESFVETQPTSMNEAEVYEKDDDDDAYLMEEPAQEFITPEPQTEQFEPQAAESFPKVAINDSPIVVETEKPAPVSSFSSFEPDEKQSGGSGSLLSSLLLLIVGAILGFGGYFLWQTMNPTPTQVPQISKMESSNPAFTSFEKLRREVDSNPETFIKTAEASKPKDAADYYLLGRAYLLNKKYEEAKGAFIEARNKLNDYAETSNRAVLLSDINKDLVIAQDKAAQLAFEREMKNSGAGESPNQANTNR